MTAALYTFWPPPNQLSSALFLCGMLVLAGVKATYHLLRKS